MHGYLRPTALGPMSHHQRQVELERHRHADPGLVVGGIGIVHAGEGNRTSLARGQILYEPGVRNGSGGRDRAAYGLLQRSSRHQHEAQRAPAEHRQPEQDEHYRSQQPKGPPRPQNDQHQREPRNRQPTQHQAGDGQA